MVPSLYARLYNCNVKLWLPLLTNISFLALLKNSGESVDYAS